MNKEILEGVFIRLEPGEKERFWEIITGAGYEQNAGGVKKFVLETPAEPPTAADCASRLLQDYPELTLALKQLGAAAIRRLYRRVQI